MLLPGDHPRRESMPLLADWQAIVFAGGASMAQA
jgi:hypothetical protein